MALKQHEFYVYNEENRVMVRARQNAPVIAEVCEPGPDWIDHSNPKIGPQPMTGAQIAQSKVFAIVNPSRHPHSDFAKPDSKGNVDYHHENYQKQISPNCEAYVRAAYLKAGVSL